MTTAAGVVKLQAELLGHLMTPSPNHREVWLGATTQHGNEYPVPMSLLGGAVDLVTYGATLDPEDLQRRFGVGRNNGAIDAGDTVQPLVALGVAQARAFRVQENMTDAITARADRLGTDVQFGISEGQVSPPRASGFVWFEQPLPFYLRPTDDETEPGVVAVTWNTVVHTDDDDVPANLTWIVVVWDDLARYRSWDPRLPVHQVTGYGSAVAGCRFVPVKAYVIGLDDPLPGTPMPPRALGEPRMRHPRHLIAALWQMLGETVPREHGDHVETVEQTGEETTKRDARIARQAGMLGEPDVTTVVLRRERKPVQNPGTGRKPTYRVEIPEGWGHRWIGPRNSPDRKLVLRKIRAHMSSNDESLPVRQRTVVNELRR